MQTIAEQGIVRVGVGAAGKQSHSIEGMGSWMTQYGDDHTAWRRSYSRAMGDTQQGDDHIAGLWVTHSRETIT